MATDPKPAYVMIALDGKPLPAVDASYLTAIRVCQRLSMPSQCELTFLYSGAAPAIVSGAKQGMSLNVEMGKVGQALFAGNVTALSYEFAPANANILRIRGYDKLQLLRKRQAPRSQVDLTVTELAANLLSDLEITVAGAKTGPIWRKIMQHNQSDLEILTDYSERSGLFFTLRDSVLHFLTLEGFGGAVGLCLGENLLEAKIEANSEMDCQSFTVLAWDPWRGETHLGKASEARCGRQIGAKLSAIDGIGAAGYIATNETAQDDDQAEALAQARLDYRAAANTTFWGIAEGNPELCPGAIIQVGGVPAPLLGRYVLTSAIHSFDARTGYTSELDTRPPPPGTRKRSTIATIGQVSRVDDPEHAGRIKAVLPSYGDLETDWIGVACPGAGVGKGFVALPSVGDKVLLALIREDPAQAVVLGGLYGVTPLPEQVILDGDVNRYLLYSPGGQQLMFDDKEHTIRFKTQTGHYAELSPEKIRLQLSSGSFLELGKNSACLHAETNLEIEAPGHTVTIRGNTINFEQK